MACLKKGTIMNRLLMVVIFLIMGCSSRNILEVPVIPAQPKGKLVIKDVWVERLPNGILVHGDLRSKRYIRISSTKVRAVIKGAGNDSLAESNSKFNIERNVRRKRGRFWRLKHFEIALPFFPEMQNIEIILE